MVLPVELSATSLSSFTDRRRRSPRPLSARPEGFDEQYDGDTLCFDAFWDDAGTEVVLVGPPLLELEQELAPLRVVCLPSGTAATPVIATLERHGQMRVAAPHGTASVRIDTADGSVTIPVQPNFSSWFEGHRVVLTLSRDNPLPWITDWLRFNRDVHGAAAVLLYDNASMTYSADELRAAIDAVAGYSVVVVVEWPFPYGPQGLDAVSHWDSDYCQLGVLEHARRRFLARAVSVMNADVDELVLARRGRSVFAVAERSRFGLARYFGRWVVDVAGVGARPPAERRHRDYDTVLRRRLGRGRFGLPIDTARFQPKWTVVPGRCPDDAQWAAHRILGWPASRFARPDVSFRHLRSISTGWKYERDDGAGFDPAVHERDDALLAAFARVDWDR